MKGTRLAHDEVLSKPGAGGMGIRGLGANINSIDRAPDGRLTFVRFAVGPSDTWLLTKR